VINFVTSGSIEERILELLKFKRSVFAGALDKDGQDTVVVGESQLNKLMKTVETMVGDMPQPDQASERQRQKEDALAEKMEGAGAAMAARTVSEGSGDVRGGGHDSLSVLFETGARLLSSLGEMIAKPGESVEKRLSSLIGRDDSTGAAYLKVPLPEADKLRTIFAGLGDLLSRVAQVPGREP